MIIQNAWLDQQTGNVIQWEKVGHTFLNEDTGEMHCSSCGVTEKTFGNSRRDFVAYIRQSERFEQFTEQHLHQTTF